MIREAFEKKCRRDQGRGNVDISEYTKSGLYSKASPWINTIGDKWMSKIDIKQVNLNPMNNSERGYTYRPLQKRVMINFIKKSCSRGREVEFQNYSE